MIPFVARRLLSGVVLLFIITTISFSFLFLSAGDVGRQILGIDATPGAVAIKNAELGLDQPLPVQYGNWLVHALTGDLGSSWFTNEPVVHALSNRLPVTMSIVVIAILITAALSAGIGMLAATRRGWVDRVLQGTSLVFDAVPSFIIAILLVTVFAINLRLFPATGYVRIQDGPQLWAASLVLPITALVLQNTAASAQQFRSAIIDVQRRDFVRTLRARHLSEREILFKHVMRAAAPVGLTVLSLQFVGLLGGSVIIEQIFALPGLGPLAVNATVLGDTPIVMGIVVYTVLVVVIVNLLVDIAIGWLNPKARVA